MTEKSGAGAVFLKSVADAEDSTADSDDRIHRTSRPESQMLVTMQQTDGIPGAWSEYRPKRY
jgi:hypothetical protein